MEITNSVVANAVAANAMAAKELKPDNPYYNPKKAMEFLDKNPVYLLMDRKALEYMVKDAMSKGIKIPPTVEKKARELNIINAVATNAIDEKAIINRMGQIYRQLEALLRDVKGGDVELRTRFLSPINDAMNALDYA